MMFQAYLNACYILGSRYHSGQNSQGYRLLCQAQLRAEREGYMVDGSLIYSVKEYRDKVAFWLRRMRHRRFEL